MVRLKRGVGPVVSAEHEMEIDGPGAAGPTGAWVGALAAVDALLAEEKWQDAALRFVLADCWARYAIVPWVGELTSTDEHLAHARQLMLSTYGDALDSWDLQLSQMPPGSVRVACSVPAGLLEEIRGLGVRHGRKIASLQTQLVTAYQNWRLALPSSGAWFVTVGEGTLAAARLSLDGWDRVHTVRIGTDWVRELKRLQVFGRLASASPDEGAVYVDAPHAWREVAGDAAKDLHWLEEESGAMGTLKELGRVRRLAA
jgi:hypothetical protein